MVHVGQAPEEAEGLPSFQCQAHYSSIFTQMSPEEETSDHTAVF